MGMADAAVPHAEISDRMIGAAGKAGFANTNGGQASSEPKTDCRPSDPFDTKRSGGH